MTSTSTSPTGDPVRVDAEPTRPEPRGPHAVSADLTFNDNHELLDFVSEDRLRASADGTTLTRQRWSTPVTGCRSFDSRRVRSHGRLAGMPPHRQGEFTYLEFHVDDLIHHLRSSPPAGSRP